MTRITAISLKLYMDKFKLWHDIIEIDCPDFNCKKRNVFNYYDHGENQDKLKCICGRSLYTEALKGYIDLIKRRQRLKEEVLVLSEFLSQDIEPPGWIVDKIIPDQGVVIFGGDSDSFKTWTAQQLALACSTGSKFLDQFQAEKVPVLYVDEENGLRVIHNRFKQLINGHGYDINSLSQSFLTVSQNVKIDTLETPNLKRYIDKLKPRLVIIDSLVRCMVGDEDKSKDVKAIFENCKKLSNEYDIVFLIIHHTTKTKNSGFKGLRGSGDLGAMASCVYMFDSSRYNNFVYLKPEKNRFIDRDSKVSLSFQVISNGENSVRLRYVENTKKGTKVGDCIDAIWDYLIQNDIDRFMTKEFKPIFIKMGFGNDVYHEAQRELIQKKKIKPIKKGYYEVNFNETLDDKWS